MSNFIEMCLSGEALLDEIDDFVDEWHEGDGTVTLHRFLGMTRSEYALWVNDSGVLPFIVVARREGKDVSEVIENFNALPLAARSDGPLKAARLMKWLKSEGLWN